MQEFISTICNNLLNKAAAHLTVPEAYANIHEFTDASLGLMKVSLKMGVGFAKRDCYYN